MKFNVKVSFKKIGDDEKFKIIFGRFESTLTDKKIDDIIHRIRELILTKQADWKNDPEIFNETW